MKLVIAVSMLINPRRCLVEHTTSQGVNFSKDGAVSKLSTRPSWYVSKKKKEEEREQNFHTEEGIHNTSELPIHVPSISEHRCNWIARIAD